MTRALCCPVHLEKHGVDTEAFQVIELVFQRLLLHRDALVSAAGIHRCHRRPVRRETVASQIPRIGSFACWVGLIHRRGRVTSDLVVLRSNYK
jgi:hypothetical protein